jgi:hypothetical protein
MVFNISLSTFQVEGHEVEVWLSREVRTANGATATFNLVRSTVIC